MTNETTTAIIITLIVGLGIGYAVRGAQPAPQIPATMMNGGMHQMPNGSMMGNSSDTDMDDMMKQMSAGLVGKTGDAFDQEFLTEMIVHHQGAVDMAQAALKDVKHQEIKDLANGIITAQEKEISMMKGWQASWYK